MTVGKPLTVKKATSGGYEESYFIFQFVVGNGGVGTALSDIFTGR